MSLKVSETLHAKGGGFLCLLKLRDRKFKKLKVTCHANGVFECTCMLLFPLRFLHPFAPFQDLALAPTLCFSLCHPLVRRFRGISNRQIRGGGHGILSPLGHGVGSRSRRSRRDATRPLQAARILLAMWSRRRRLVTASTARRGRAPEHKLFRSAGKQVLKGSPYRDVWTSAAAQGALRRLRGGAGSLPAGGLRLRITGGRVGFSPSSISNGRWQDFDGGGGKDEPRQAGLGGTAGRPWTWAAEQGTGGRGAAAAGWGRGPGIDGCVGGAPPTVNIEWHTWTLCLHRS